MAIRYALFENNLTSDPDDYMAMVQPVGTAGPEDIYDRVIERGSTVTRADLVSALEDYNAAITSILLEGMNVTTPLANFSASIKGTFDGRADSYDPARHQITAVVNPGVALRDAVAEQAQAEKQEARRPAPTPLDYVDMNSDARNSVLTPGGMGQITGHRLKFDPADTDQGIFFIAADGTETRVDVVGRNKPADLMFLVPAGLAPGDYTLEVRAHVYGGDVLRSGQLDTPLTVS